MKRYIIICTLLFGLIPLDIKAQNEKPATNPDSIMIRIIEILKQENLDFYYYKKQMSYPEKPEYHNKPYYARLKSPKSVTIMDNTVKLSFGEGERSVSLLQKIRKNNEVVLYFAPPMGWGQTNRNLIWGDLLILNLLSEKELLTLQNNYLFNVYWGDFNKIVKEYNSLEIKPTVSEEQRKYIVQANALNEQKDYKTAIQLLTKVIQINPTSYPAAYFNLALISSQVGDYLNAIVNMKKYLSLVPEAEDARTAQDKIYEWEFMLEK